MKSKLIMLAACLATSAATIAQTDCASATSVVTDPAVGTQYCLLGATVTDNALSNPNCYPGAEAEGWYSFTITTGPTSVNVSTGNYASSGNGNNARNIAFEVFSGTCGSLTSVACVNANGNGADENTDLYSLANGTYYVAVYNLAGANNATIPSMDICVTGLNNPPSNDDCANAIPVTVGTNGICTEVTGTVSGATDSGVADPGCGNYQGGDVWFSITVPASGNVTFATDYAAANSITDADMAIYSGTCGSLTLIECDDLDGTGLMPNITSTGLTPGSTVYVRLWEYGDDFEGDFDLCISEPPVTNNNQDCNTSTPLCSDQTINGASNGTGSVVDLTAGNQDCLGGENQTSWFTLQASTAGNFAFSISPDNGTDDYDFAVWHYAGGAGQACPPAGTPDRCSFGAGAGLGGSYDTGLGQGAVDFSENSSGDNWVAELPMAVGDVVVLVVDNYSSTTSPYTLDFTGTVGLDCSILPVELLNFYVLREDGKNMIHWKTHSELNNDYFTLEHSIDGKNWQILDRITGAGTTHEKSHYAYAHENILPETNYYKLYQTDFNGVRGSEKIISIDNKPTAKHIVRSVNLVGQEVDENYSGLVIQIFSDGSSVKKYQ